MRIDQARQSCVKLIQHKDVWGSCLHNVRQCYTSSGKESKVPFGRWIRQYIKRVRKLEMSVVLSERERERALRRQKGSGQSYICVTIVVIKFWKPKVYSPIENQRRNKSREETVHHKGIKDEFIAILDIPVALLLYL